MLESIKEIDQLLRREKQDKQHEAWIEFCHAKYYWSYDQQFFLAVFLQILLFCKNHEITIPVHVDTIRTTFNRILEKHVDELVETHTTLSKKYNNTISKHLHPSDRDAAPYSRKLFSKFAHVLKTKEKFCDFLTDIFIPFIDNYYAFHIKNRLRTKSWSNRLIFMECEKYRLVEYFFKMFNPAMHRDTCPHKLTFEFYKSRNKMSYVYKAYRQNPVMRVLEEILLGNRVMRSVSYVLIVLGFMFITVFFGHAFSELSAMLLQ